MWILVSSPSPSSPPTSSSPSASAETCTATGIGGLLCKFQQILNSVIPLLIALGMVYFVWGVVQYVIRDGEEAKKKGKDRIIYGIIGLAVIVGLWGLVKIVVTTFGLEGTSAPVLQPLTGDGSSCNLDGSPKFQDLVCYITRIINDAIIPLLFAVATAFFVWGTVKFFIINVDDEKKRQEGKQFMLWGIIALAVMISVWGLVAILGGTFGIEDTSVLPQVSP